MNASLTFDHASRVTHTFVISGPGGVGKGTLVRKLVAHDDSLCLSRSWTTRKRRPGEPSDAYVFVSDEAFRAHADRGGFLEWVEFLGNRYGTPMPAAEREKDLILEIELEGAQKVKAMWPDAVLVFIVPPSTTALQERLAKRGDSPDRIAQRLDKGKAELAIGRTIADEIVENDDLESAVAALQAIIRRHRETPGTY